MGYTESDLPIVLEDVIEDVEEKEKRSIRFAAIGLAILAGNGLIVYLLVGLLSGSPDPVKQEASIDLHAAGGAEVGAEIKAITVTALEDKVQDRDPDLEAAHRQTRKRRTDLRTPKGRNQASGLAFDQNMNPLISIDLDPGIVLGEFVINVRASGPWSELDEDEVARNLGLIESYIKRVYPTDETAVTMVFDDGRPNQVLTDSSPAADLAVKIIQSRFRHLSPRLYRSVDLKIARKVEHKSVSVLERASGNVIQVDILVNAAAWDAEPTEDKVNVLNDTTAFLEERYPEVTPFVTLNFDDGRKSLPLRSHL
jgi:hypothetical protein